MSKHIFLGVLFALLVGAATWWIASAGTGVRVDVAPVAVGEIRAFVDEQAKTRLPETYLITMPLAGRIEPITLVEGERVTRGQVVARLVQRDLDLAVEQARAAVDRLEASIAENADVAVEQTGKRQAEQFVESMASAVQAAVERVKSGAAEYDFSEKTFSRTQRLSTSGAQTQEDLDRATLTMLQSKFDLQQDRLVHAAMVAMQAATNLLPTMIDQYILRKAKTGLVLQEEKTEARAQLAQVLQDQQRSTMTSPVDGVVLARRVTNERYLPAGETLLEIGRLEEMEIEAELLTLDAAEVRSGNKVEVYGPAVGPQPVAGTVTRIYPAGFTKVSSLGVEQQRVMVIVRVAADDLARLIRERGLGVGYRVRVRIITAEQSGATIVPRASLVRNQRGQWQVFAVRGDKAQVQLVDVGLMNDEQAQVLHGLSRGDRVILAPETTLVDGTRVSVVE